MLTHLSIKSKEKAVISSSVIETVTVADFSMANAFRRIRVAAIPDPLLLEDGLGVVEGVYCSNGGSGVRTLPSVRY